MKCLIRPTTINKAATINSFVSISITEIKGFTIKNLMSMQDLSILHTQYD